MLRIARVCAAVRAVSCSTAVLPSSRLCARRAVPTARAFSAAAHTNNAEEEQTTAFTLNESPAEPVGEVADEPAAAAKRVPRPSGRHAPRRVLHPALTATPLPPVISSQAEMDALLHKGHDGRKYDMLASYQLGQLFFDGIPAAKQSPLDSAPTDETASAPWSLPKNYTQSLLWFTNAAFEGHVPSRTRLGVMYLAGYGIKRDFAVAFQLFTESSEWGGDRDAMAHLAAMHLQGIGASKKDVNKAIQWYTKAAELGLVRAQAVLAKLLSTPDAGAARDDRMAAHWLKEAAQSGHLDSQFLMAQRSEASDPAVAFDWYAKAAQNGHAHAQYLIGLAHANNTAPAAHAEAEATERRAAAARWFSLASEQGNVHAQARLGFMLFNGIGVKQDCGTGIMWLNNAAEANHVDAQLMLGSIAYEEHLVAAASPSSSAAATPDLVSLGSKEDDKQLQTAKHYFSKVLENANKNCTTLPPGSLPLLVRMAQDASLPSQLLRQFHDRTGEPWLGDINVFLADTIRASKTSEATQAQ